MPFSSDNLSRLCLRIAIALCETYSAAANPFLLSQRLPARLGVCHTLCNELNPFTCRSGTCISRQCRRQCQCVSVPFSQSRKQTLFENLFQFDQSTQNMMTSVPACFYAFGSQRLHMSCPILCQTVSIWQQSGRFLASCGSG